MKLTAELSKFKVKEGKVHVVDQWMTFLNKHMEFWNECIDSTYQSVDMDAKVVMIQEKVRTAMQ